MRRCRAVRCAVAAALAVLAASGVTGCGGSGSPSSSSSSAPAAQALVTDQQLHPGVTYAAPPEFSPGVTFTVPTDQWFPYVRDGGAFNLRVAKGPAEADFLGKGIEVAPVPGSAAQVLHQIVTTRGLTATSPKTLTINGRPALVADVTPTAEVELAQPESLRGELLDPGQGVQIYAIDTGPSAVIAIVATDTKQQLASFAPDALRVVRSFTVDG